MFKNGFWLMCHETNPNQTKPHLYQQEYCLMRWCIEETCNIVGYWGGQK